ncbi:hypothetical protein GLOIN_2v1770221 [Rhizophagus clarus]|uniref:Uncharacterized protein n=1 Tax=Rhizophagus clarus TaxID=94130 RepID=A0A8H3LKS6_9GLOM|nr:hypothetical protein GLOIN_2v1770221 [Rhizophagus clarus]
MSGIYIDRPEPNKWIGIIINKYYNKIMSKPINLHPGYDIEYTRNTYQFSFSDKFKKMIEVEKIYDNLSIISLSSEQGITKTYYSIYEGRELVIDYHRPNIHNSKIAICFDCWKLAKIPDVKPKKTYFAGWKRYGYEIKPEDLMKHHWNNECSKAKTEDESVWLIQRTYRNYKKKPISLAKQIWEAIRNNNTPRKKKFLDMPKLIMSR